MIATQDNAFAYEFASFGGSGLPLMTLEIRGDQFVVTTDQHRNWVAVDAGFQWGSFTQDLDMGLGWLAAWAADECTLSGSAQVFTTIDRLETQGYLNSQPPGWPDGAAYVSALRSFLSERGYC